MIATYLDLLCNRDTVFVDVFHELHKCSGMFIGVHAKLDVPPALRSAHKTDAYVRIGRLFLQMDRFHLPIGQQKGVACTFSVESFLVEYDRLQSVEVLIELPEQICRKESI